MLCVWSRGRRAGSLSFSVFLRYKLLNGKYVAPTYVEAAVLRSPFVVQCFVHGANLPANVAVVVPNWARVHEALGTREDVVTPAVQQCLEREVMEHTKGLKAYTIPRAVVVADAPFTVANGMATQKLSMKRGPIHARYEKAILTALKLPPK